MKEQLLKMLVGQTLSRQETRAVMLGIIEQKYNNSQVAALLMAMQARGATVDEILGLRDALLETGKYINLEDYDTLDIVGTGGDGKNTFNIRNLHDFFMKTRHQFLLSGKVSVKVLKQLRNLLSGSPWVFLPADTVFSRFHDLQRFLHSDRTKFGIPEDPVHTFRSKIDYILRQRRFSQ